MKTIEEMITDLIPYVEENFITFSLFEEGDYRPQINIWKLYDENKLPFKIKKMSGTLKRSFISAKDIMVDFEIEKYGIRTVNDIKADIESLGGVGPFLVDVSSKGPEKYRYKVTYTIFYNTDATETSDFDLREMLKVAKKVVDL